MQQALVDFNGRKRVLAAFCARAGLLLFSSEIVVR